jgi:hypothetical protein
VKRGQGLKCKCEEGAGCSNVKVKRGQGVKCKCEEGEGGSNVKVKRGQGVKCKCEEGEGGSNPGRQFAMATESFTVAPNFLDLSMELYFISPTLLRWILNFVHS